MKNNVNAWTVEPDNISSKINNIIYRMQQLTCQL